MPDLPTFSISDAQMAKVLEAFQAYYGTSTPEATATAYRRHLGHMIKDVVIAYEAKKIDTQRNAAIVTMRAQMDALLGDPDTIP